MVHLVLLFQVNIAAKLLVEDYFQLREEYVSLIYFTR